MAPRWVTSDAPVPSSTPPEPSAPPGSGKPGPSQPRGLEGRRKPPMLRMVLEALQAGEQRRGTSVAAIKLYILHRYPPADAACFKYLLKQALATGLARGLLARPAHSRARGATGSFKLVPKHKRKIQPRKRPVPKVPRKAAEARPKGPQEGRRGPWERRQEAKPGAEGSRALWPGGEGRPQTRCSQPEGPQERQGGQGHRGQEASPETSQGHSGPFQCRGRW